MKLGEKLDIPLSRSLFEAVKIPANKAYLARGSNGITLGRRHVNFPIKKTM